MKSSASESKAFQSRSKGEIPGRARRKERLSRSKLKQAFLADSDAELFMYLIQCTKEAMFFFHQVEVHHFYRPKTRNNSMIWVQKSNKHIPDGYKKLFRFFKREAVQFLVAKNLALSHLPLEAFPAVQTWTANCKRDRKTVE